MRNHFQKTSELLKYNWKTLLIFEVIYRLFGLAVIFPVINQLLYLSVKLTGHEYLVNNNISDYLSSPYTFLIGILLFLLFGIYITFEIVVLSVFFHSCIYKNKIGIYTLLIASISKLKMVILKYNIVIVFSSMVFLLIVEGLHLVGIASTIKVPAIIYEELQSTGWFYPSIVFIVVVTLYLFIQTIFFELQCTIESTTIKSNIKHSRKILKANKFNIVFEFLSLNFVLNAIFYIAYFIIIGLVGVVLFVLKADNTVYPLILTLLYTIYLITSFFATIVLIPINFGWINIWYYENKETIDYSTQDELQRIMKQRPFSNLVVKRIASITSLLLTIMVIFVLTSVSNNPSHLELFNTPTVIAHRGGGDYAPENTISGIEMGIDLGADSVEFDVRFTVDGVPILMHDSTLGRTTNDTSNRAVNTVTLAEIKELDAGSWFSEDYIGEQVPTLAEALEVIGRNIDIFIELKADYENSAEIIVQIIEEASVESQVKVISFNSNTLEQIKAENERIETLLLISSFIGDINTLVNKDYVDDYGFYYSVISNNSQYVRTLQQAGKDVYVWTVNDEAVLLEMINLNVDGIITDKPLLTRELVYGDSKKSEFTKLLELLFIRN